MLKRLFKIKRYFLVSYDIASGSGYMDFTTYNGGYLNKKLTIEQIKEVLLKNNSEDKIGNIIITNIIEISKRDCKDFMK